MSRITIYCLALSAVLYIAYVLAGIFASEPGYAIFSAASSDKPVTSFLFRTRIGLWTTCPKFKPRQDTIGTEFPPFNAAVAAHFEFDIDDQLMLEVADKMIAIGCNVNDYDSDGFTALHRSVYFPDLEAVKYLLTKNADLSMLVKKGNGVSEDFVGMSALSMARFLTLSKQRTLREKKELNEIKEMLAVVNDAT